MCGGGDGAEGEGQDDGESKVLQHPVIPFVGDGGGGVAGVQVETKWGGDEFPVYHEGSLAGMVLWDEQA